MTQNQINTITPCAQEIIEDDYIIKTFVFLFKELLGRVPSLDVWEQSVLWLKSSLPLGYYTIVDVYSLNTAPFNIIKAQGYNRITWLSSDNIAFNEVRVTATEIAESNKYRRVRIIKE